MHKLNGHAFIYTANAHTYDGLKKRTRLLRGSPSISRRRLMHVKDLFQLEGKVALITGGSRGLGLQMAEALGEMGCRVAITARKADELAEAKAHLEGLGIEVHTIVNDLAKFDRIPDLVSEVLGVYD